MTMKIIGLYGRGGCGKSETLNRLKELLRIAGKSVSSEPHPWSESPETFEFKGFIICVAPGGDTYEIVNDNCKYFESKKCDVAVSATRTKWGSVDALNDLARKKKTEIDWVEKSYEYGLSEEIHSLCNKESSEVLFRMICDYLNDLCK